MSEAFAIGVAAGYGVAIPIGAIALLIVQLGARRGFATAAAAGAGAATADLAYALAAVLAGSAALTILAPVIVPARLAAAVVLVALAVRVARSGAAEGAPEGDVSSLARTYLTFIGLTLLNPTTMAYFASFVIGLPQIASDAASRIVFAGGAFVASLSWQTLLAFIGASLYGRISGPGQRATSFIGAAILLAFAVRIALEALRG